MAPLRCAARFDPFLPRKGRDQIVPSGNLVQVFDVYEPAGKDEEGAYNITITEDMTRQDVLKEVLAVIAKI